MASRLPATRTAPSRSTGRRQAAGPIEERRSRQARPARTGRSHASRGGRAPGDSASAWRCSVAAREPSARSALKNVRYGDWLGMMEPPVERTEQDRGAAVRDWKRRHARAGAQGQARGRRRAQVGPLAGQVWRRRAESRRRRPAAPRGAPPRADAAQQRLDVGDRRGAAEVAEVAVSSRGSSRAAGAS